MIVIIINKITGNDTKDSTATHADIGFKLDRQREMQSNRHRFKRSQATRAGYQKRGVDPRNAKLRTKLESGIYECEIETDEIELYTVVDFGEVMEKGRTATTVDFLVEDGATIKVNFDGKGLTADSDGAKALKQKRMNEAKKEWYTNKLSSLGVKPDSLTEEQNRTLMQEFNQWQNEYYQANPMLAFLLELASSISNYQVLFHDISSQLDLYHRRYESLYPGHSAHDIIKSGEGENGPQIVGRKYHDYSVYNLSDEEVKAPDYYSGKPTLVIFWATWCLSCRADAIELVPLYEKYKSRGLNAFSIIAREFNSADNMKAAVAEDKNPWECLYDMDDKFKIFDRHGVSSSAFYLIDADGTIAASGYEWSDIEPALQRIFPD